MKGWSIIFGIGLALLWLAGITSPNSAAWLAWLDGVAAICAFIIGGAIRPGVARGALTTSPIALSVGLFALWLIGLATNGVGWQNWWTFVFACCFLVLGIYGGTRKAVRPTATGAPEERERFRRAG